MHAVNGFIAVAMVSTITQVRAYGASESVRWNFGGAADGTVPNAGMIMDASRNLYGTTADGGTYGAGTVFRLTAQGSESILWNLGNGTDGKFPTAGLIMDASGNLYGTTFAGGANGAGTVFELTAQGSEAILWNLNPANGDGQGPRAGLVMDPSGNLYGTTVSGGPYGGGGTAFMLSPPATSGGTWTETILWNFGNGTDGFSPYSGLIMDASGNLYGTTHYGGTYGFIGGTVFKLAPPAVGGRAWTESILWNFGNGTDGRNPAAGLLVDPSGNFYGTTQGGGTAGGYPGGTVFKLTPGGTETVLWNFDPAVAGEGLDPMAGLLGDTGGNLYGTTQLGGAYGEGAVFELTPPAVSGGNWTESILWSFFNNGTDGQVPFAGLVMGPNGNLYGTTQSGGTYQAGAVFQIASGSPTPSPTSTPSPSISPTPVPTPPTVTPAASASPAATPTPTATPTPAPTPTAVLIGSPARLNFGKIDTTATSRTKKLTFRNRSLVPAQIGVLVPPASFVITNDTCSNAVVEPKKQCTVEIAFAPATVLGSVNEPFVIPYNGASPSATLAGTAIAVTLRAPAAKTLPHLLTGAIGKAVNITIANRSAATVQLGAAGATPNFLIVADGCANLTLAPAAHCVVTVELAPAGGSSGELSGTLGYEFIYGANSGNVAVALKGKVN